jgi:extracellular elastinolytic metalloproteinase
LEYKEDPMITYTFDPKVETDNLSDHTTHSHKMKASNKLTKMLAYEASYVTFPLGIETLALSERTLIVNPAVVRTIAADAVVPSPLGWHNLGDSHINRREGNNRAAHENINNINGSTSPDSFAETTKEASLEFGYPIDLANPIGLSVNTKATTVNLFVWNNYMHDISYLSGFGETNGSFQEDDYNRFGGNDDIVDTWNKSSIKAKAQDGVGLNNANFDISFDVSNPRMQMYL